MRVGVISRLPLAFLVAVVGCRANERDGAASRIDIVEKGARISPCARPAATSNRWFQEYHEFPCRVVAVPIGTVLRPSSDGTTPDPNPGLTTNIVRDTRGRVFTSSQNGDPLQVWDGSGKYLVSVGRRGRGPGEFVGSPLQLFVDAHDTLHALDGARRWHVFNAALQHIRTFTLTEGFRAVALVPGGPIVSARTSSPRSQNSVLRLMSLDGNPIGSRGDIPPDVGGGPRLISVAPDSSVWIAPAQGAKDGYILENRRLDGSLKTTIRRDVPWYPPSGYSDERRLPSFRMLSVDADGLIWVMIGVKDARWYPRKPGESSIDRERAFEVLYDLRVEVIDPKGGHVLASVRYDHADESTLPPVYPVGRSSRLFWGMTTDSLGQGTLAIYRLELVR